MTADSTSISFILNNTQCLDTTLTPVFLRDGDESGPSVGILLWASVNFVLFICILCGNTLTVIAVRSCRRLRSAISNLFILSLAVSDFIVGLALPFHMAFYLGSNFGNSHGLCLMRFFLMIFACCVSILTLIAIAIDRYIAIIYALHYRRYMTRRVALLIIAFNWLVGASVGAIPIFWNRWSTAVECEFNEILPPWYMAGLITPGFVVIWTFMLLIYWRIMREASKQVRQMRHSAGGDGAKHIISDWKSVQIVVFIMGCFSICWLPYFVVACAQIFDICTISHSLYQCAFSLAMSNSGLNPIIYCWKNSVFRTAFVRLLRCRSPNVCGNNVEVSHCSDMRSKQCRNVDPDSKAPTDDVGAQTQKMECADVCVDIFIYPRDEQANNYISQKIESGIYVGCKKSLCVPKSLEENILRRVINEEMSKYSMEKRASCLSQSSTENADNTRENAFSRI